MLTTIDTIGHIRRFCVLLQSNQLRQEFIFFYNIFSSGISISQNKHYCIYLIQEKKLYCELLCLLWLIYFK
jgi:hypothetical protein